MWPTLMPLGRRFDGFVEHAKRVSPTCRAAIWMRKRDNQDENRL